MIQKLKSYGINENLIKDLEYFRNYYKVYENVLSRIQ